MALKGLNNNTTTGYTYLYDQLNRLLNTRQHTFGAATGSFRGSWTQSNTNTTDNYAETFRYDANGNILQLNRNGNSQHPGGLAMDRLNYTYRDGSNQLWSVQDGIAAGAYAGDIDNQGGSNYSYDRIGNLIGDVSENISQVNWTVYGKIGNIQKKQAFLGYVYNAGGERVVKQYLPYATNQCAECPPGTGIDDLEVYERNSAIPETYKARKTITFLSEYTDERYRDYSAIIDAGLAQCTPQCNVQPPLNTSDADIYIRDATGNVLAVYHYDRKTGQLRWSEQHLYGSARLGMYLPEKSVTSVSTDSKEKEQGYLGKQIFELSNHLGNVLATITDKKLQVSTNNSSTSYFEAEVQSVQDYYAFGMQMPGRKLSGGYRYGFNGHEREIEINTEGNFFSYNYNGYDARIGRRFNRDIFADKFPFQSPYVHANNSPIVGADISGDSTIIVIHGEGVAVKGSNGRTNVMYFVEVFQNLSFRNYNLHRSNGTLPKPNYTTELARDAHDIKAKGKIVFHSEKRYGTNNETPPGTYYLFKRGTKGDSESGRYELYIGDKSGSRLIKGPDGNRLGIAIHQYDPNDSQGCLTTCSGANTKPITDFINAIPDLNDDKQPVVLILQPREIIKTQYQDNSNGKVKYQGVEHVYYGGFLPEVTVKTTKIKNK